MALLKQLCMHATPTGYTTREGSSEAGLPGAAAHQMQATWIKEVTQAQSTTGPAARASHCKHSSFP